MKVSTVREFRDHATGLLRPKSPILVTRRGRLAAVFFPWPESTLPLDFKKELGFTKESIVRADKPLTPDFHHCMAAGT